MKNFLLLTIGIITLISSLISAISVRIAPFVFVGLIILKIAGITSLSWLNIVLIPIAMFVLGFIFFIINIVISATSLSEVR